MNISSGVGFSLYDFPHWWIIHWHISFQILISFEHMDVANCFELITKKIWQNINVLIGINQSVWWIEYNIVQQQ